MLYRYQMFVNSSVHFPDVATTLKTSPFKRSTGRHWCCSRRTISCQRWRWNLDLLSRSAQRLTRCAVHLLNQVPRNNCRLTSLVNILFKLFWVVGSVWHKGQFLVSTDSVTAIPFVKSLQEQYKTNWSMVWVSNS